MNKINYLFIQNDIASFILKEIQWRVMGEIGGTPPVYIIFKITQPQLNILA